MAGELDQYKGRKPSIGFGKGGPYIRGFRSRPGAPQHDPNTNRPMSGDALTNPAKFQTAWDRAFRDTASNNFGAAGINPLYTGTTGREQASPGFDISSAEPAPGTPDNSKLFGFDISGGTQDQIPTMEQLANGGMSHQDEWSRPRPGSSVGRSFGWEAPSEKTTLSIFDKYKTKDGRGNYARPGGNWGWDSAFKS